MSMRLDRVEWPNGARVAITLTVAFELWEGLTVETGYHDVPVSVPPHLLKQGVRDEATLNWQEYGGRRGMQRLLEIVNRHEIPVTAPVSGLAVERYPEVVKRYHESGHEICGHSWAQDVRTWMLDEEAERDNIRRCRDVVHAVTGAAPAGWISPSASASASTPRLLWEAGYLWHGDYSDDDIPYFVEAGEGTLVAIPYQYDLNDLKVYVKGMHHAGVYVDWFKHKFDFLYAEGESSPGMLSATVHASLYGRPFGAWAVDAVARYARSFPDVWFTTRGDIARWMNERYG